MYLHVYITLTQPLYMDVGIQVHNIESFTCHKDFVRTSSTYIYTNIKYMNINAHVFIPAENNWC